MLVWGTAYSSPIPNCHHNIEEISDYGSLVKLDNGSKWKISNTDVYKVVMSWNKNNAVVIEANTNWFSSYSYYLTNKETGSTVGANLIAPPLHHGPKTRWIQAIDKFSGHLFLDDCSSWKIASEDLFLFEQWKNGDSLILGVYRSWFSSYEYILINVETNCYVRATPF
jgi:hypothetical protein